MLWGVKIWKIVFWTIAFPVFGFIGIYASQGSQNSNFSSGQKLIENKQISAARNLTGTWTGSVSGSNHIGAHACTYSGTLKLVLEQSGNNLNGNWEANITDSQGDSTCLPTYQNVEISEGTISSSAFQFMAGSVKVNGSFTTDLMNGNGQGPTQDEGGTNSTYSFRLMRQ